MSFLESLKSNGRAIHISISFKQCSGSINRNGKVYEDMIRLITTVLCQVLDLANQKNRKLGDIFPEIGGKPFPISMLFW